MNDTVVGGDTIGLMVDVNGCRVCAVVFHFCGFLHLFCTWRLFLRKNVSPEGSCWLMLGKGCVGFVIACFRQHGQIVF